MKVCLKVIFSHSVDVASINLINLTSVLEFTLGEYYFLKVCLKVIFAQLSVDVASFNLIITLTSVLALALVVYFFFKRLCHGDICTVLILLLSIL